MSDSMKVDSVLSQIRAMQAQIKGDVKAVDQLVAPSEPARADFSNMLKQSIDAVNSTQKNAAAMAAAYERGDSNMSLAEVMVNLQKADVSFKALTEVRNKFVDAYQEVMRMSM